MNVVFRSARQPISWAMAVLFWTISVCFAQEKQIKLRNQVIRTHPVGAAARISPQAEDPVSGLYLVQLEGRMDPSTREALAGMGIELLTYVPDDAFIIRLRGALPSAIRALPTVRWLGEYRPDYKLHSALTTWWKAGAAGGERRLNVLLSPKADPVEHQLLLKLFSRLEHSSETRFGGLMRGRLSGVQLMTLLRSALVLWVEPAPQPKLVDEVAAKIVAGDHGPGVLYTQSLGFDGSGVTVAVADSGLDTGLIKQMHPDIAGRVSALFYYGELPDASDGHSHGTHVTGIVAGNASTGETDENGFLYGLGVAPGASIVAQRIFDAAGGYEAPPSYETLTRNAVQSGADIGSNSWGDDTHGAYDISAAEFDALVRDADALTPGDQPYILEFSAGNAGPGSHTIGSPAVGKNVIASGASQNDRLDLFIYADGIEAMADFSSRGPCEDGRIKPDVVAPGTWIASMKSRLASDENAWGSISENYIYQGGTSQAGPQVSGAAAVYVQYHKSLYGIKPSPAMVKAVLINSAVDMDPAGGTGPVPNDDEGWGRVDLTRVIGAEPRRYDLTDQTVRLASGQVFEKRVIVTSASEEELKITLAYTDMPGFPGVIPSLVNDLDLEVVGPDGTLYRGNQFAQGESVRNALASDRINNVEGVTLLAPQEGEYVVRVRAFNVVQDSVRDTVPIDQDFALVISGGIPAPGVAAILLDRGAYTAPSIIRVAVLDPSKAGQSSLTIGVRSETETNLESVLLRSSGSSLLFTGAIATATGPAVPDGRLQVVHGNHIEFLYGSGTNAPRRTARADLLPPAVVSVRSTNEVGSIAVLWQTDEPADATVYYGLTSPTLAVTNLALATAHSVELSGLVPDRDYVYFVVSRDEAGNTRTNNNGGAFFTFHSPLNKTLLLVDAYEEDILLDSTFIPLSTYTQALDAANVSYDVWDRSARPEIKLENLRSYRVVMWRINDIDFGASISAGEIATLVEYLSSGGSFCMSSMEGLSRFNNSTFNTQIAHVAAFVEDLEAPQVQGLDGDVVSGGVDVAINYANYPDFSEFGFGGPDFSDHLTPTSDAAPLFLDAASSEVVGVRYPKVPGEGTHGRSIFLAFPLDGVPMNGSKPNTRPELIRRMMAYLAPGADGRGTISMDSSRYTLPSRIVIEVGDSDLAGKGRLEVRVVSETDPTGILVSLLETAEPGVFRGDLTLVPAVDAAAAGRLRAREGDAIRADYLDATAGVTVSANALVDTAPPVVSSTPVVEPDYEGATISWETSEPSDSLVEFGESTRLGRTAYSSGLSTTHELTFQGLTPDRTYYFKVTSKDLAGNTVQDDNTGELYSFRTLKPLSVPWSDNMEDPSSGWTVIDSEGTQSTWVLGVPSNGLETQAHSPSKAWGSNITGASRDEVETFLISPAFFVSGGNRATLRFWHSYDFLQKSELDILNGGEVLLVTNNAAAPITLLTLGDEVSGWVEEEIDLTPYLGTVASVVFHYVLFSFDSEKRPGWLVDDVSIDVETVQSSTIEVTNNLFQARYFLTGPVTRTGQGLHFIDTNVTAGEYTLTFNPVPFYRTPPPQTNTVAPGGKLLFKANYVFDDTNANGISDDWEKANFGAIAPSHPPTRDTDGDGRTDLAEFLAGTNPNSKDSVLKLSAPTVQPGGAVVLNWGASAGRAYRVVQTLDFLSWEPVTDWLPARTSNMSQVIPSQTLNLSRFFRVEVLP